MIDTCLPARLVACSAGLFKTTAAAQAFCDKLTIVSEPPLADRLAGIEEGVNTFFLTIMGALVFVMHAGFAMVRSADRLHVFLRAFRASCLFNV